jgi:hypothetical protein
VVTADTYTSAYPPASIEPPTQLPGSFSPRPAQCAAASARERSGRRPARC